MANMLVYCIALVRSIWSQRFVDFGALFAIWIAASASHAADLYWASTSGIVLVADFLFPPSLAITGPLVVGAHSIAQNEFAVKHIGAILIALASLSQLETQQWIRQKIKMV